MGLDIETGVTNWVYQVSQADPPCKDRLFPPIPAARSVRSVLFVLWASE